MARYTHGNAARRDRHQNLRIVVRSLDSMAMAVLLLLLVVAVVPETESFAPPAQRIGGGRRSPVRFPPARGNRRPAFPAASDDGAESAPGETEEVRSRTGDHRCTRRTTLAGILSAPLLVAPGGAPAPAVASEPPPAPGSGSGSGGKRTNLSNDEILEIIVGKDLVENQFLVNGRLTRDIYDESCTFRDEIDTYGLEQWMKGTANLFDANRSRVVLVPGSVKTEPIRDGTTNGSLLQFRFVEYLCFNIPVLKPIVYLSGTLYLTRSNTTGLVTSYREQWDQDVKKVLTSESKLFTSGLSKESLDKDLDVFFGANARKPVNG